MNLFTITTALLANLLLATPSNSASWQEEMLQMVNKIRVANNAAPLKMCSSLELAAQRYSREMAQNDFLDHTGKDGSTMGDRLIRAGYLWKSASSASYIGENIAAGQKSVSEVVKAWKKSPGHFKNIVSKRFTHVGFGKSSSKTSKYGTFWVQNFGAGVKC